MSVVRELPPVNEVRLRGRVSSRAQERVLPSGDRLWTLRVVVDRAPVEGGPRRVDTLDCAAWTPRLHRVVAGWRVGDVVEVQGVLRRRFYRAGGAAASRTEVELMRGRVLRRATT